MSKLDAILTDAVDRKAAPFVVGAVTDRHQTLWSGAAGPANHSRAADQDTVFSLFSMTKAIGGLMAVIAIDRGLVTMDTPVGDVLPEFDSLKVLVSVGPDGPTYREPRSRATLRHLLTHTTGQGYDAFYPLMAKYFAATAAPTDLSGTLESLNYPMLFDPGDGFAYGIGTDLVGAMVARLDGRSVDEFARNEVLVPLGMSSTFFERDEAGDRVADLRLKAGDGSFDAFSLAPAPYPEIYHMGHALYSTASDYLRFMRLILNNGRIDDREFLSEKSMQLIFQDQLPGTSVTTPILKSSVPVISFDVEPFPGVQKTHTAASFRNESATPGMRRAGSLWWAGVLNTHFWIDPSSGLGGVFMTQMLPFFDPDLMAVYENFERTVYQEFG